MFRIASLLLCLAVTSTIGQQSLNNGLPQNLGAGNAGDVEVEDVWTRNDQKWLQKLAGGTAGPKKTTTTVPTTTTTTTPRPPATPPLGTSESNCKKVACSFESDLCNWQTIGAPPNLPRRVRRQISIDPEWGQNLGGGGGPVAPASKPVQPPASSEETDDDSSESDPYGYGDYGNYGEPEVVASNPSQLAFLGGVLPKQKEWVVSTSDAEGPVTIASTAIEQGEAAIMWTLFDSIEDSFQFRGKSAVAGAGTELTAACVGRYDGSPQVTARTDFVYIAPDTSDVSDPIQWKETNVNCPKKTEQVYLLCRSPTGAGVCSIGDIRMESFTSECKPFYDGIDLSSVSAARFAQLQLLISRARVAQAKAGK